HLEHIKDSTTDLIQLALMELSSLEERVHNIPKGIFAKGFIYRYHKLVGIVRNSDQNDEERQLASAALLYFKKISDVLPDNLEIMGIIDDDFAFKYVLNKFHQNQTETIHWSENICKLWDDLPFLQGMHLCKETMPLITTWIDRVNAYVIYKHALDHPQKVLIIHQPTIACLPIYSILALAGLELLDSLTIDDDELPALRKGQTCLIAGKFYGTFQGICSDSKTEGCAIFKFSDGTYTIPSGILKRTTPVSILKETLSSTKDISAYLHKHKKDVIQKFFKWYEPIGASSVRNRIALVTSKHRYELLFNSISSNGVKLVDDGLAQYLGMKRDICDTGVGVIIVVPSIERVRGLIASGTCIGTVFVDGIDLLKRGKDDITLLRLMPKAPKIIVWENKGLSDPYVNKWLLNYQAVSFSDDDISELIELDEEHNADKNPISSSLWQALIPAVPDFQITEESPEEISINDMLKNFIEFIMHQNDLPDYWKYNLTGYARNFLRLIGATPALWTNIKAFVNTWYSGFHDRWSNLSARAYDRMTSIMLRQRDIFEQIQKVMADRNSKAEQLLRILNDGSLKSGIIVCLDTTQVNFVNELLKVNCISCITPKKLSDLEPCMPCVVCGWYGITFAKMLKQHVPSSIITVVSQNEKFMWEKYSSIDTIVEPQFSALTGVSIEKSGEHAIPTPLYDDIVFEGVKDRVVDAKLIRCVFLWFADTSEAKVLNYDSKVIVESNGKVEEIVATRLQPNDRAIIGNGMRRWTPADEFINAIVTAIRRTHPRLAFEAKEWRTALKRYMSASNCTLVKLQYTLSALGVKRELNTLEGWLDLERPSPIAPQQRKKDLKAMWDIISEYTDIPFSRILSSCRRLRNLRWEAAKALLNVWKGFESEVDMDERLLHELVDKLKQEVEVREVTEVWHGKAPECMFGWWVTPELATSYRDNEER
ncbi:hypothetical protein ACFL5S_02125, partial [Fibrobacterota bacterium]